MANRISIYEELQVEKYLYDLYLLWGRNLEESMCISEGWIVYLDGKENIGMISEMQNIGNMYRKM